MKKLLLLMILIAPLAMGSSGDDEEEVLIRNRTEQVSAVQIELDWARNTLLLSLAI